jgi:cytochrome c-type biogenesis protein
VALALAGVALFGAGLAATFSPCVLPLVPGYLGVLGAGTATGDGGAPDEIRSTRLARVSLFAVSAVLTFALLGAVVGTVGGDALRTGRWAQRGAGAVVLVLAALLIAGRLGRRVPSLHLVRHFPRSPLLRSAALGVGCGAAWTPCAGPLLGAALTAAAATGAVWRSTVLLVCYASGVVMPFVALAALGRGGLPRCWRVGGRWVSTASAMLLVVVGLALTFGWYDGLISRLWI